MCAHTSWWDGGGGGSTRRSSGQYEYVRGILCRTESKSHLACCVCGLRDDCCIVSLRSRTVLLEYHCMYKYSNFLHYCKVLVVQTPCIPQLNTDHPICIEPSKLHVCQATGPEVGEARA